MVRLLLGKLFPSICIIYYLELIFNGFYYSGDQLPVKSIIYRIELKTKRFEREREDEDEDEEEQEREVRRGRRRRSREGRGGRRKHRGRERGGERGLLLTGVSAAITPLYFTPLVLILAFLT